MSEIPCIVCIEIVHCELLGGVEDENEVLPVPEVLGSDGVVLEVSEGETIRDAVVDGVVTVGSVASEDALTTRSWGAASSESVAQENSGAHTRGR